MGWRDKLTRAKAKKWFYKQSLPLGFLLAIVVSMAWPAPGEAVAHWTVNGWKVATTANMSVIFFIFGVTLDSSELLSALKAWRALAFGLSSILVLTPLTGFLAMLLPFKPYEFALGLAVMACVPTSLSSGVTLVISAYGNGALALLFTVASNIAGIAVAPVAVKLVLGSAIPDARVDGLDLLVKLGVSILMPVVVGKALRELAPPVKKAVAAVKPALYLVNNAQITMIVWQKLSSAREVLVEQEAGDVLLAAFAAVLMHFVFLLFNMVASWLLRLPEAERKAIIVMASQKNLPTAAVIISYFDAESVGNPGLITIPCIVFYIMQLFIDAFVANAWASKYERLAAVEASYSEALAALAAGGEGGGAAGSGCGGGADQPQLLADKLAGKAAAAATAATTAAAGADGGGNGIPAWSGGGSGGGGRASAGGGGGGAVLRPARLSARGSGGSDDGLLLTNVALDDVNPLLEPLPPPPPAGAAAALSSSWRQQQQRR